MSPVKCAFALALSLLLGQATLLSPYANALIPERPQVNVLHVESVTHIDLNPLQPHGAMFRVRGVIMTGRGANPYHQLVVTINPYPLHIVNLRHPAAQIPLDLSGFIGSVPVTGTGNTFLVPVTSYLIPFEIDCTPSQRSNPMLFTAGHYLRIFTITAGY